MINFGFIIYVTLPGKHSTVLYINTSSVRSFSLTTKCALTQGQWGGGNRGGGGGGGGWGGGGGGRGGGGGGRGGQTNTADFKETVRLDRSAAERPKWQLTCYGHEREGPNDLSGDISAEELRWANMLSAERGASMAQLTNELKAAEKAKVEQFQALQRAHRAPTKGGPSIPPPTATISNLEWVESGTYPGSSGIATSSGGGAFGSLPFGQPATTSTPFGGGGAAAAAASSFGQPAPTAFGQQPATGTSAFGSSLGQPAPLGSGGGGFGGAFGATTTGASGGTVFGSSAAATTSTSGGGGAFGGTFGGASKPVFGQQAAGMSSTPFGSSSGGGAPAAGGFGTSAFGGAASNTTAGFGSAFGAPSSVVAASPYGQASGFGQAPATSTFGVPAASAPPPSAAPALFGGQSQPAQPFGGAFGSTAPTTTPFGAFGGAAPQTVGAEVQQTHQAAATSIDPSEAAAWEGNAFEKGKIPENAPPPVYCR